jgi:hypothetical protein
MTVHYPRDLDTFYISYDEPNREEPVPTVIVPESVSESLDVMTTDPLEPATPDPPANSTPPPFVEEDNPTDKIKK